jgi:guanine deaminase
MSDYDQKFMRRAIELARKGMNKNAGGPFGCVVVKDGKIISEGYNRVTSKNDRTVYTSCEPCPMCLGAIYWSRPKKVFYACSRSDAAAIEFDDQVIYDELELKIEDRQIPFNQILREEAVKVFNDWTTKDNRTEY